MRNTASIVLFCLIANLFAPVLAHAAPEAPALGLLGVQQAGVAAPAALPRDGVVVQPDRPAGPAPAEPGFWSRTGSWLWDFGVGVKDGLRNAVPNLIKAFKDDPIKTTLMVGGLVALGIFYPPGALVLGGALIAKSAYESGGDPTKLGQLTGETLFWSGIGFAGARGLRALKGKPVTPGTPRPGAPLETPVTPRAPVTETPVSGAPIGETPLAGRTPVTETPVTPRTPVTEPPATTGTPVTEPIPTTPSTPVTEPVPATPARVRTPRPQPAPEVVAGDNATLAGRPKKGHWSNPPQPAEIPGAPAGSQKYVADSNVFSDMPGQSSSRARMDRIIVNPANELTVPSSIQNEFLGARDVNGTQGARWSRTDGAVRRPVADPAGIEALARSVGADGRPMIEGAFGQADLVLLETALKDGATVVTRNFRLIEQIRGPNAPRIRAERYKNVKIEYIGD